MVIIKLGNESQSGVWTMSEKIARLEAIAAEIKEICTYLRKNPPEVIARGRRAKLAVLRAEQDTIINSMPVSDAIEYYRKAGERLA